VQVFFFLSGVMVAQSFDRSRSAIDFAVARGLRIFPALIVCVLLTSFVMGAAVSRLSLGDYLTSAGLYAYIVKTLTLSTGSASLPGVFETLPFTGYVNSSLWTLKYEVLCYVGLGALGIAGLFRPGLRALAATAMAVLVATIFLNAPARLEDYGFLDNLRYFIVFFGAGVFAYLIREHLPITPLAVLLLFVVFMVARHTFVAELSAALFLGYASLWLASLKFGPGRDFCNRYDTSFGIYIYAGPVQQSLLWAIPSLAPAWLALLAFAIVLPIAFVSWIAIEKPALSHKSDVARRLRSAKLIWRTAT
jgi:peptidoglycan/LPS O-acetylase OafA/YrhL